MSKTWKRYDGWRDGGKAGKRAANQAVRRYCHEVLNDIDDGGSYKKLYDQWSICDWNCTRTPQQQSYVFHNPHRDYDCICCNERWTWRSKRIPVEAPEPVWGDHAWTLPLGYQFTHRWKAGEQRVNPETGEYERKMRFGRWVWRHEVGYTYWSPGRTTHERCYYKDMDWHYEEYEEWTPEPEPEVVKWVEGPYFTEDDVRRHVESREKDTRNYRYHQHWPRYWRRDRKRARRMKAA